MERKYADQADWVAINVRIGGDAFLLLTVHDLARRIRKRIFLIITNQNQSIHTYALISFDCRSFNCV